MENSLQMIKIEGLYPSKENEILSMNDIDVLEESIKKYGVLTPLTVYYSPENPAGFTVLSGHRRLEACKRIGLKEVPVQVISAPKTANDEFVSRFNANIARYSDEDITTAINAVAEQWEGLSQQDRAQITVKLKEVYDKKPGSIPSEFRPRDEYIRAVTGINVSVRSIRRKLTNEAEPEERQEKEKAKPAKKEKKEKKPRSFADFCKGSVYELHYLISENAEEELPIETREKIQELIEIMLPYIPKD